MPQPQQQKLKLKVGRPSGIKLKFGGNRESPASTPGPVTPGIDRDTPGITASNDAPISTTLNGTGKGAQPANPGVSAQTSRSASAASPPAQPNGIKDEGSLPPTAAPSSQQHGTTVRPPSGSPRSQSQAPAQPVYNPPISQHGPPGLNIPRVRPAEQSEWYAC